MSPPPDADHTDRLLHAVRAGDSAALEQLLAQHRPFIRSFVELRIDPHLRARVDPSDVVQEAQIEAVRRVESYLEKPLLPFRLWLRQIAYDRLLMLRRQHVEADRRSISREAPLPDGSSIALAQQALAAGPSPSQQLVQHELVNRVRLAVAELPETDREILLMRNFEGLSNQEVAQVLDLDPATASKRYGRALLRLRQRLIDSGVAEGEA
jgi:RNA polymerase sigma-70 factor (ECF subfamily)